MLLSNNTITDYYGGYINGNFICRFKEYVSNAPTPQDAMNRQQMLNKFTNNVSNVAKQLEDVIKRYANIKKNTTGKNDW